MSLLEKQKRSGYGAINDTNGKFEHEEPHPETQSNMISRLFLSWVGPLIKLGNKRQLNPDDAWPLQPSIRCGPCTSDLVRQWDGQSSLLRSMARNYGLQYTLVGGLLFTAYACDFFGPIVLKNVVGLLQAEEASINFQSIALWLGCLFLSRIIKSICFAHFYLQTSVIMLKFTSAMKGYVFQKSLKLSASSRAKKNTGDIVNIYTTDVNNIMNAAFYLHYMWVLPCEIAAALYMLYDVVGVATFAGVGTIILALCVNNVIARLQVKYFQAIMKVKDERMKAINELFGAIQIVKLNGWEEKFRSRIAAIRTRELDLIWKYMRTGATNISLLWGTPVFVSTITFTVYAIAMKQNLQADKVFTAIALFNLLREPLRSLPNYITGLIQAGVSVKRLKEFSNLEERDLSNIVTLDDPEAYKKYAPTDIMVDIANGSFVWEEQPEKEEDKESSDSKKDLRNKEPPKELALKQIFGDMNLTIRKGEFVVVHGKVGSGKSSFCSVLLGDMKKTSGSVFIGGKIAYCPQQAWIQNLTVRENILFGLPYEKKKYDSVVAACGLLKDMETFASGDQTEIGEKGLNVSGGQKARISLARACYSDADIFLFDSPLSAVDAIVQNEIFTKGLLTLLSKKTIILVSHNPDIISSPFIDRRISFVDGKVTDIKNTDEKQSYVNDSEEYKIIHPLTGSLSRVANVSSTFEELKDLTQQKSAFVSTTPLPAADILSSGFTPLEKRTSSFMGTDLVKTSTNTNKGDGKLVVEETREEGQVGAHVYKAYFKAVGGIKVCIFLVFVQIIWQGLQIGSDFWLSIWTSQNDLEQKENVRSNISIYAGLAVGSAVMVAIRAFTISNVGLKGAKSLFNEMTNSLILAPMSFFDANPLGRQLNRYSDDVSNVDFRLPFAFGSMLAVYFSVGATFVTAAVVTKYLGLLLVPVVFIYVRIGRYYITAARELQRLQKVTQSPVLAHVSESVDGAHVIRAFGVNHIKRFYEKNEYVIDKSNSNQYAYFATSEWFALRMQLLGGVILLLNTASLVILRSYLSAGVIGLAFNYGLAVDQGLESIIQIWAWLEVSMISPERIQEYIDIPREAPHQIKATEPDSKWPTHGAVSFKNVSFRYKAEGNLVLKDISFDIKPSEKIGIVGRTGAGKSSLTMVLFRINEVAGGKILIDGVDTSTLGLRTLRSRLSIITQAPVLFKGTLRGYLDPFEEYSDESLWNSLRKVGLSDLISKMEKKLESPLEENGDNFSVGERQMLCMSRALLSESNVVVMDEATAAIDHDTDMKLQKVIRSEFTKSTVITIAHRLDTVLDSDRIMVLDAGEIVEFDSPKKLISKGKGHLYDLAKEGGYLDRMDFD